MLARQYFDAETGKNYNYFRDYDPSIGRYVESDPIGLKSSINTYAYVDGDPLTGYDPDGLANSGPAGRGRKPDYWWRPCNKTQESQCKAHCAAQGKEFESCAVRFVNVPGVGARQAGGGVSCSCIDPEPSPSGASKQMCGENCRKVMVFLSTAFIGLAHRMWRTILRSRGNA